MCSSDLVARLPQKERAQAQRPGVGIGVGAIAVGQGFAQGGEPGRRAQLGLHLVEHDLRQDDDLAHAACRTSGKVRPYLVVTSVARFMKSWRISSLVRCLMFHLRKISLFFDFDPPKNDGR